MWSKKTTPSTNGRRLLDWGFLLSRCILDPDDFRLRFGNFFSLFQQLPWDTILRTGQISLFLIESSSKAMEQHPADETKLSVLFNVVAPAVIALGILVVSMVADFQGGTGAWTQRSGNILIVIGAYIGYHESKRVLQFINDGIYFNPKLWYKVLAIVLVIVGTVVSGYGDLIVRAVAATLLSST